jgi:hypothetical protein
MAGPIKVDRDQWLGYRWLRHGLDGRAGAGVVNDLLLLGIQGSRGSGAEQALIQRTSRIAAKRVATAIGLDGPLVSLWSVRGAPHAHRVSHLDFVRDALAPRESDEGGARYLEAVGEVATALRAVVKGPTSKATASREVTDRVPASLVTWCPRCQADHVPEGLFRVAGRQAQIVLGPEEQRATMLHPPPKQRQEKVKQPPLSLLNAYFRVNGPTTRTLYRDWTDGDAGAVADLWSEVGDDLVRVQVDNKRYDMPEAVLTQMQQAARPAGVVLVPPNDPYLRQVDRTLLVPEAKRRQQVWKALSGPGALLVDGEVAGTWRYRRTEGDLTISPFGRLVPAQRRQAEQNAELVAAATGDESPTVTWS